MQFSCNAAAVLTLSLKLAKTRHNTLLHFGSSIVFWIMKWQVNAVNPHLGAGEGRTEMKLFRHNPTGLHQNATSELSSQHLIYHENRGTNLNFLKFKILF